MSWNSPATVAEIADSITRGFPFHALRFDIEGHVVAVLSGHPFSPTHREHSLTDHVATGATWAENNYRTAADRSMARTFRPDVVIYYLRDRRSGLAMAGVQQDGTVLDEIATVRPDLRSTTIAQFQQALRDMRPGVFRH